MPAVPRSRRAVLRVANTPSEQQQAAAGRRMFFSTFFRPTGGACGERRGKTESYGRAQQLMQGSRGHDTRRPAERRRDSDAVTRPYEAKTERGLQLQQSEQGAVFSHALPAGRPGPRGAGK